MTNETLQEAAEKYAESNQYDLAYYDEGGYQGIDEKSFAEKLVDFTTKWQAKKMYSEEEVKNAFKIGFNIGYSSQVSELDLKEEHCNKWFEQFKKK